jgi:hypothetical protein
VQGEAGLVDELGCRAAGVRAAAPVPVERFQQGPGAGRAEELLDVGKDADRARQGGRGDSRGLLGLLVRAVVQAGVRAGAAAAAHRACPGWPAPNPAQAAVPGWAECASSAGTAGPSACPAAW